MKNLSRLTLITVVIAVIGAGGYAAWHAWDKGIIGNNPRAPTPQAMDKAVRIQAAYTTMMTGARIPCFNIDSSSSRAEIKNVPGISPQSVPGQHVVTMLLQTNTRDQQARDAHLAQLGYLAKKGLFTTNDVTITTDDGVDRPAKSFQLTWNGYAEKTPGYSSSLCLNYGRRDFAGIETIEKSAEQMMGLDVYEVTYKTIVKDVPEWAAAEDAKRYFPKLVELIGGSTGKAKVLRTNEGWRSAYEIEAEMAFAARGGNPAQLAGTHLQGLKQLFEEKQTISLEEANQLASQYLTDPDRHSKAGIACLPLHLQRGGDEKEAQGARDAAEFAVTYYDKDRKSYEYQTMARALHVLSALEGAGLAEMEVIRPAPTPIAKIGRRATPEPTEPPKPVGVRFKVSREAMTAMGMSGYGGGCIPAGRTKYEVLAVRDNYENIQSSVIVRAAIDQTPEWALKVAELLPALKVIIENGMPMHGTVYRMADGSDTGKWKLSGLNPMYPTLSYESIPTHLKPLMPLTAAVITSKPVKAPALVPELRGAAPAARADHSTGRQIGQGQAAAVDHGIAHVGARGDRAQRQSIRNLRGQVLEAVYGDVDVAVVQGSLQLGGEEPLAADERQRLVEDAVALRVEDDDLGMQARPGRAQQAGHVIRLPACQRRTACAQSHGAQRVRPRRDGRGRPWFSHSGSLHFDGVGRRHSSRLGRKARPACGRRPRRCRWRPAP